MADHVLLADSLFAKALREPNLLVPGKKSVGPIHVKQPNNKFSCVWPLKAGDYLRDWTGTKPLTNTLVDLSNDKATWNNTTNQRLTATRNVHADQFSLLIQFTQTVADGAGIFQQHISGSEWPILIWITAAGDLKVRIRNASSVNVDVTAVIGFTTSYLRKNVTLGVKYDGANIKTYLDGQFMASASQTGNIKASIYDYVIGNYYSTSGWVFPLTGSIELVALETTQAVSDEQLRQYTKDPWGELFKPANDAPFLFPVASGGFTGAGAGTLEAVIGSASGAVVGNYEGTGAGTLAAIIGSATGNLEYSGTAAGTLAAVTGSATGILVYSGTAAGALSAITGSASGTFSAADFFGTGAGMLAAITGDASGAFTPLFTGTGAGVLAAITGAATGSVVNDITGTGAGALAALTAAGVGSISISTVVSGEHLIFIGPENRILAVGPEDRVLSLGPDGQILRVH